MLIMRNPTDVVLCDHNYSRRDLYGYHLRPTKNLFNVSTSAFAPEGIDVSALPQNSAVQYDSQKSRQVMEECERFVMFARSTRLEETNEDWEESISRSGWSTEQHSLFQRVVTILHTDRLARLALQGSWSEPAKRRSLVDRSAQRFREALAGVAWNVMLTQWLHGLLIEHLDIAYLSAYLDILQTLKVRVPTLVDRLIAGATSGKVPIVQEGMNLLLKRPWDPAATSINSHKLNKLPANPVIVLVPSCIKKLTTITPRCNLWSSHLSSLATLVTVSHSLGTISSRMTAPAYLEQMVSTTKARLAAARADFPGRPLVVVGWKSGAGVALQAAAVEHVAAVVSLGFSTRTAEGARGDPDDSLFSLTCPVLFVTGEHSNLARPEDLEEIRSKMVAQTGLIVVGAADNCLRMRRRQKVSFGVTQSMVDRKVLEEIGDFLANILMMPAQSLRPDREPAGAPYRRRRISTGSSEDEYGREVPVKQLRMALTSSMDKSVNGNIRAGIPVRRGRRPGSGNRTPKMLRDAKRIPPIKTLQTLSPVKKLPDIGMQAGSPSKEVTLDVGSIASLAPTGPIVRSGLPQPSNSTVATSQHHTFRIQAGRMSALTQQSGTSTANPSDVMPLRLSDSSTTSGVEPKKCDSMAVSPVKSVAVNPRIIASRPVSVTSNRSPRSSNVRSRVSFASGGKIVTSQNNVILLADTKRSNATVSNVKFTTVKSPSTTFMKSGQSQQVNRIAMDKRFVHTSPSVSQKPFILGHRGKIKSDDHEPQDKNLLIIKSRAIADSEKREKPVVFLQRSNNDSESDRSVVKIVKSRKLTLDSEGRGDVEGKRQVILAPQRTSKQLILTQSGDHIVRQERSPKYVLQMQNDGLDNVYYVTDE